MSVNLRDLNQLNSLCLAAVFSTHLSDLRSLNLSNSFVKALTKRRDSHWDVLEELIGFEACHWPPTYVTNEASGEDKVAILGVTEKTFRASRPKIKKLCGEATEDALKGILCGLHCCQGLF